jgi:signal transduction histidine kinase
VSTAILDRRPPRSRGSDPTPRWRFRARTVAIGLSVAAYTVASLAILPPPSATPTTYVTSTASAVLLAGAGLGLLAVGATSWIGRPGSVTGPLAVIAGVGWLAPLWLGWTGAPALARSVAALAAPLVLPAVAHLALASPADRATDTTSRGLAVLGWVVTGAVSLGLALFRNPLQDLRCWSNCSADNVFLASGNLPVARAFGGFWLWFSVAYGGAVLGLLVRRLTTATAAWRNTAAPVVGPAALVIAGQAAYAAMLLVHLDALRDDPVEPAYGAFRAMFTIRAAGIVLLAFGVGWALVRDVRRRTAIGRLAEELAASPRPGTLEAVLARSLGDRSVRVQYWLPSLERWVDPSGQPVAAADSTDRATVTVQRGGQPVARVDHERADIASATLVGRIGAAARLAIDNERLRAEVLSQLEEVRRSRARLVEAGDAARRDLERDLHDGAQQRLLAVLSELRWAKDEARDDPERVAALARLSERTRDTLAELREIAHGIFPVALDDAGIAAGLAELSAGAAVPVEVDEVPETRFPPAVERAAYLVVAEAVERRQNGSTELRVRVRRNGGQLLVGVTGASPGPYTHLADRVSAVGGILTFEPDRLQAVIPCASSSPTTPS